MRLETAGPPWPAPRFGGRARDSRSVRARRGSPLVRAEARSDRPVDSLVFFDRSRSKAGRLVGETATGNLPVLERESRIAAGSRATWIGSPSVRPSVRAAACDGKWIASRPPELGRGAGAPARAEIRGVSGASAARTRRDRRDSFGLRWGRCPRARVRSEGASPQQQIVRSKTNWPKRHRSWLVLPHNKIKPLCGPGEGGLPVRSSLCKGLAFSVSVDWL
jgi:hypothetical protein